MRQWGKPPQPSGPGGFGGEGRPKPRPKPIAPPAVPGERVPGWPHIDDL